MGVSDTNSTQGEPVQAIPAAPFDGTGEMNAATSSPSIRALQWKMLSLVILTACLILGGMMWKTQKILVQDKTDFVMDSAMKQIAPLKRLVQQRLRDQKEDLIRFAGLRTSQELNPRGNFKNASFADFDVVSLVQPTEGGQWAPSWVEVNPSAKIERWPKGHELTLLKSLPYSKVRDGETVWTRLSDRQGSPVYAFMLSVEIQQPQVPGAVEARTDGKSTRQVQSPALPDTAEQALNSLSLVRKAVLVGFASTNPLAEVTEDFVGSTNSVYLIDDRGYVAAHVNKAYQGALFTEDPLVREILKGRKTGSTGKFEDLDSRPVLGHYERIEHSNLYAVITAPEQMLNRMVDTQERSVLEIGLAILLACLFIATIASWFIARGALRPFITRTPEEASNGISLDREGWGIAPDSSPSRPRGGFRVPGFSVPMVGGSAGATTGKMDIPSSAGVAAPLRPEIRSQTDRVLSEGLVRTLSEPLLGILGHASLVRAKASDDEVQAHADSIAREARHMREVIERINAWQDDQSESTSHTDPSTSVSEASIDEKIDIRDVIEAALKKYGSRFKDEGIFLTRELRAAPLLRGSRSRIEGAIMRLIDNAIEAMRARPSKHLKIYDSYDDEQLVIRVTDTGIGMSRDIRERAFEPFFKAFEGPNHLGLGLASVASIVKALGGSYQIDSVPGEGSTFILKLPIRSEEKQAFEQAEARAFSQVATQRPNEVSIPSTPKLTSPKPTSPKPISISAEDDLSAEIMSAPLFISKIQDDFIDRGDKVKKVDKVEGPAGASSAAPAPAPVRAGPLMLDEHDDDDESFTNVSLLSKAAIKMTKAGQAGSSKATAPNGLKAASETVQKDIEALSATKRVLEVRIRKPKIENNNKEV